MSKRVPKIRFRGFTDTWMPHVIGEFLFPSKKIKIAITSPSQLITVKLNLGGVSKTNSSTLKLGSTMYYRRKSGQFIYGKQNFFNGSMAIIPTDFNGMASSGDVPALDITNINTDFLIRYVSRTAYFKPKEAYASGTGSKRIHEDTLRSFSINVPSSLEQEKIGLFFKQLDKTIALHQRQLELLKEQKKGFLQKMFPKAGETVPEIRFQGFADDWEQRKLSEGTSKIGDGLHGTPKYTNNGNVAFINGNNLINGRIVITKETKFVTESDQSKDDKLLNNDTILISINGTIGNLAWYSNEKVMLGKSAAYLIVSVFNKKFIYAYLQTPAVNNYFMNNLTGTTIKNLGLKTIRSTNLFIPVIKEQQKIGQFFKQLDKTIFLHQCKLDALKEMKKGFLQKMFI